jgi:hypothetical protein
MTEGQGGVDHVAVPTDGVTSDAGACVTVPPDRATGVIVTCAA